MDYAKKAAIFGILFVVLVFVGGFTQNLFLVFLGVTSLIVAWVMATKNSNALISDSDESFAQALKNINFTSDKTAHFHDRMQGLAINENQKEIAIVRRKTVKDDYEVKKINFNDIIEAKVITNKETITSTSIGSVATRGIIGGVVAGGIGSIIGGVTAKQHSVNKIKELKLEIVVDDLLNPRHTVTFYKSDLPIKESNPIIQEIEEWYRTFSVIINRNSKEARSV